MDLGLPEIQAYIDCKAQGKHEFNFFQAGTKMGLTVVLDAHTNLVGDFSIGSDFQGFTAAILPSEDFPLTYLNEFQVKPGTVSANIYYSYVINIFPSH